MVKVKFEIGGRSVEPHNIGNALEAMALQTLEEEIRRKISGIRHPETGECPVILFRGRDLEHLAVEVSGSKELVQVVAERLGGRPMADEDSQADNEPKYPECPIAFLCHASEDKPTARRLAHDMQDAGIETFFDEWEMKAGDSLRQKIDSGLGRCTHFVALLSPKSLTKPWVNLEMDGALVRKLEGACVFVPLRIGLCVSELPPLLRGMDAPSLDDYEQDVCRLISDIHNISRKPPLGQPPVLITERPSGINLSPAAAAIVQLMVERSETGMEMDPDIEPDEIQTATGLSDDDIVDAVDELRGLDLVRDHPSLNSGKIGFDFLTPESELFVRMDRHFKPWNPEEDALRIAADLVNDEDASGGVPKLAERYGWDPRRMNPAVEYLVNRKLIAYGNEVGTHPWSRLWIRKTAATRRYVRDRSRRSGSGDN
jgi:hypothetical protein